MSDVRPALVLVVDDEASVRKVLKGFLEAEGYRVVVAKDAKEARSSLKGQPSLVITDFKLPGEDGLSFLRHLRSSRPEVPVVMMTAFGTIPTAVAAIKAGAHDFLVKPLDFADLKRILRKALASGAADEREWVMEPASDPYPLIGRSAPMVEVYKLIAKAGPSDATVLILGETGTGKELVAAALHAASRRKAQPFIKVNCGAIPEDLLEAELFGYEKGSFTGATRDKPGKFELADGGTVFLDEVGEMSPAMQVKLLRTLQSGEFDHVGGVDTLKADVRVLAATHQDLKTAVTDKKFREDLYYRLNVVPISIPPLRDRRSDIPELATFFLERLARKNDRSVPSVDPRAMEALQAAPWQGNVRQLENLLERLLVLLEGDAIRLSDIPPDILG
ncbi:MAG: sigma-54-dependent Fis family transcriptional regulator [Elusimicrobia bacterium]|nr:sigma-54-dependent Fis family transcriptional regulator [Elusimicrobiota bacterium]